MQMLYQLSYAPNDRVRFRCSGSDSSSSEDSASNECNLASSPGWAAAARRLAFVEDGDERTIHLA
jgi:hypothetical protein